MNEFCKQDPKLQYRKDVQILRGIAVLMVVFFHLNIAGFAGGFLGVDVFFVISGYLMAGMYTPLNKMDFFIRRAKRLLPAYFTVVFFTLIFALVITTPNDYWQVVIQAIFSTFFASNIGFWIENSYFDKATFKPLLHLWSLGIEIQFYLVIPVLYWAFKKFKHSYLLITVLSAGLCFFVVGVSPKTSFFWLPFRLWEFLIGFGIAAYFGNLRLHMRKKGVVTLISTVSLLVILSIPFFSIDGQASGFADGHPGLFALLIVFATATTLAFGIPAGIVNNPISDVLETVGNYSYSIYLAHFPLIVLYLYQPFSGTVLAPDSASQTLVLVALLLIASTILYRLVERPFRANKQTLTWVLGSVCLVLGLSQVGVIFEKVRTPEKEMLIYRASFDRAEYRCGKVNRILHPWDISCEITDSASTAMQRVLLVGNSHADSIKSTFAEVARARNVSVYFLVENTPLLKGSEITPQKLVKEAQARNASSIVLHYSPHSVEVGVIEQLVALAKEKQITISFIMPVPVWDKHVPKMLWKNIKGLENVSLQSFADYQRFNMGLTGRLSEIDYEKFKVYQVADVFCGSTCLLTSESGSPLYFDSAHLTLTGSEMLRGVFDHVIADLL